MSDLMFLLGRHDAGRFVESVDEILAEVAESVVRNGGKGTVTVKIEVSGDGGHTGGLRIVPKVTSTLPAAAHGEAFYWRTERGLSRTPPADEADNLLKAVPAHKETRDE